MTHLVSVMRFARRLADVLLIVLIASVLALVVLARVIPAALGGTTFVVGGPSMEPTIPVGSAVYAAPVKASDLRTGDVVSLQVGPMHAVFTHRVVRLVTLPDGRYLETKGDANDHPDPAVVPVSDVVGRVAISVPYAGYGIAVLSTIQGVAFVVMLGLTLLVAAWLLETFEDERRTATARTGRRALGTLATDAPGEAGSPG